MLRGMTGYQLTQTDSEFLENMRVEKLLKKLQVFILLPHDCSRCCSVFLWSGSGYLLTVLS